MSSQKRSSKQPRIKITTKRPKKGIKLRNATINKKTQKTPSIFASSIATSKPSISLTLPEKSLSSPYQKNNLGLNAVPSILTKQYHTTNNSHNEQVNKQSHQNKKTAGDGASPNDDNEQYFDDDENASDFFDEVIKATEDVHDIVMAIQSINICNSAAVCQLMNGNKKTDLHQNKRDFITFVLKPMIKYALNSTSLTPNNKTDQVASAYISTGFNIDLEKLESEHQIRLIQLHGLTDELSNDDENVAVLLMNDYVDAVYDAATSPHNANNDVGSSQEAIENKENENQLIIKLFLDCIYHHGCNGMFVTKSKLLSSLKSAWNQHKEENISFSSSLTTSSDSRQTCKIKVCQAEKWIQILVHIQLLLPRVTNNSQTKCTTSFWYTLPKMGIAAKGIMEGRKKMMNKIQRSYNKEMRRSKLENFRFLVGKGNSGDTNWNKRPLHCMTGGFYVRDLLARDVVKIVHQPSGDFIRLTTSAAVTKETRTSTGTRHSK